MKEKSNELWPIVEEIARLGSYEANMLTGTWIGSDNFIRIFALEKKSVYTLEEFQAIVHADDFAWVMAYFKECLSSGKDFNCEYRCVRGDGEVVYVNSRSKVYYNSDGTASRILGIKQDITTTRLSERRLQQLNENNYKKNEVLSWVAHDLRTPISQLEGLARLIQDGADGSMNELFSLHDAICKSAHGILNEIIEIAELEDESYRLETALSDVKGLMEEIVLVHKINATEKGISIRTSFQGECKAHINRDVFFRMINNLLSNAIKFTPASRAVELSTLCDDLTITIVVKDQGIGIKEEHLPFLFEKFSKPIRRSGTKGERSTGLGLAIVKRICDLHNGSISVESHENIGTTFTLTFPKTL